MRNPLELGTSADQRIEVACSGPLGQIAAIRRERIRRNLARLFLPGPEPSSQALEGFVLSARAARCLRDSVGDVLQQIEPRDSLGTQQRDRVRVGLVKERHQHVSGLDLVLLGALGVVVGVLQHAVEGQRLASLDLFVAGHPLEILFEETLELLLEAIDPSPGVAQDVDAFGVVTQGVEQVLDGHVRMTPCDRLSDRRLHGHLELTIEAAHSFSTPVRSG